jgi:hypothetical protein
LKAGLNVAHASNSARQRRRLLRNRLCRDGAGESRDTAHDADFDGRGTDLGVVDQRRLHLCRDLRVFNRDRIDSLCRATAAQEEGQEQGGRRDCVTH